MPKVSVIIPVYNVEKYLRKCLDSVVNQTLKDIEIICIDDGSKDSSGKILDEYAAKDHRIKVIHKENGGYGKAMNAGIDQATGEYIGIVESDDFVKPNMYKVLADILDNYDVDFAKTDHYDVWGKKLNYGRLTGDDKYYNKSLSILDYPEVFKFCMYNWAGLYRADFIKNNNIRHNTTPGASYQDNGFHFQVFALAKNCYFLNEAYYCYRHDNQNSSINNSAKMDLAKIECDFIKDFIDKYPGIAQKYMQPYYYRKFDTFKFTYQRLSMELKKEFVNLFKNEFENIFDDIDKNYIGSENYHILAQIIKNPQKFHRKAMNINTFWENILSFKNVKDTKVITVAGMRFKIKRKK